MDSGAVVALQIATVVFVAAVVVATWCSRDRVGAAAVHDVERALGAATIMTYEQAVAGGTGYGKAQQCCAICLSDYATGDELVRVVPACGHFFHAECGVDAWLRAHRTCPLCRGGLGALPRPPRPECPPMPQRAGRATVG